MILTKETLRGWSTKVRGNSNKATWDRPCTICCRLCLFDCIRYDSLIKSCQDFLIRTVWLFSQKKHSHDFASVNNARQKMWLQQCELTYHVLILPFAVRAVDCCSLICASTRGVCVCVFKKMIINTWSYYWIHPGICAVQVFSHWKSRKDSFLAPLPYRNSNE